MPGTTARYQLPYPTAGDPVASWDETYRALTARLETVLAAAHQPPLTPSDFDAAIAAIAALNASPVSVASPIAPAAGWGIVATLYSWQKVRLLSVAATNNTGAAITANTNGVFPGSPTVGTVIAGHRPLLQNTASMTTTTNGAMRVTSAGAVQLLTYLPSAAIAIAGVVSATFPYLVT